MACKVDCCLFNFQDAPDHVREVLEQNPHITFNEHSCVFYCGNCVEQPFALVNRKKIAGTDWDDLLTNISSYIESIQ